MKLKFNKVFFSQVKNTVINIYYTIKLKMSFENKYGTLDLIGGGMCAGKTTELLRRLFNESEAGLKVLYVNHSSDTRSTSHYSTHNPLYKMKLSEETKVKFITIDNLSKLKSVISKYDVIGIDECQFFEGLYENVKYIVDIEKKHVIVSGLNGDFRRNKFGNLLDLIPIADTYKMLRAYCKNCSKNKIRRKASFSHIVKQTNQVKNVGGTDMYIPLCRECYLNINNK